MTATLNRPLDLDGTQPPRSSAGTQPPRSMGDGPAPLDPSPPQPPAALRAEASTAALLTVPTAGHYQVSRDGYLMVLSENGGMSYKTDGLGHRIRVAGTVSDALDVIEDTAQDALALLWQPVVDALLLGAHWREVVGALGLPGDYVAGELVAWGEGKLSDPAWDQLIDLIHTRGGPTPDTLLDTAMGAVVTDPSEWPETGQ